MSAHSRGGLGTPVRPAGAVFVTADEVVTATPPAIEVRSTVGAGDAMVAGIVAAAGPDAVVVQDVPLLVETGQQDAFDTVIVVEAPLEERLRRMVEDRGMTPEDAQARIDAQATDDQRRAAADVVIVNDADLERLASVANQVWDRFLAPDAAEPSAD